MVQSERRLHHCIPPPQLSQLYVADYHCPSAFFSRLHFFSSAELGQCPSVLSRDSISLEELDRADSGGAIARVRDVDRAGTVRTATRLRRVTRLDDRDKGTSRRGKVLTVLVRYPEHDTVCPPEANLYGVLASSAGGVRVSTVELPLAAFGMTGLGRTFSNMTPVCPPVYVPVALRSLSGSWVRRPSIAPPVEYQLQNAACAYLPSAPLHCNPLYPANAPVGILDGQSQWPRLALALGGVQADVSDRPLRLFLQL